MNTKTTSVLDILGISSATICLAHCLIFPVLSILPIGIFHNHWIDLVFCCVGMFVVSKVILSKALRKVKIILGISILFVMLGVTFEIIFESDFWLILIGGSGMIVGHIINFKTYSKINQV